MDVADVLNIALGIIGILVMVFCGAVWHELMALRKSKHDHANKLTELRMAMALVCRKVGINPKTYEDDDEHDR